MVPRASVLALTAALFAPLGPATFAAWQPVAPSPGKPPQNPPQASPASPMPVAPGGANWKPNMPAAPGPGGAAMPVAPGAPAVLSVAVLPFRVLKNDANAAVISESMQQAVVTAINGAPTVKLYNLTPAGGGRFETVEMALAGAKAAGVAAIIYGTYQATDFEARVTASVYQSTGKLLGVANAKGNPRDTFAIQDDVARQVREILAPGWKGNTAPAPQQGNAQQGNAAPIPGNDMTGVTPVPFEGSSLQRALNGQDPLPPPPAINDNVQPIDAGGGGVGLNGNGAYGTYGTYRRRAVDRELEIENTPPVTNTPAPQKPTPSPPQNAGGGSGGGSTAQPATPAAPRTSPPGTIPGLRVKPPERKPRE